MKTLTALTALLATGVLAACSPHIPAAAQPSAQTTAAAAAPEFTGIANWLNGPPQRLSDLRGKVVLVEFWTYSCINCIHVLPYVKQWHASYKDK